MYYVMSYKRHAVHKTLLLAWALACKVQEPRLPLLILESLHMKEESLSGIIKVLKTISLVSSSIIQTESDLLHISQFYIERNQ